MRVPAPPAARRTRAPERFSWYAAGMLSHRRRRLVVTTLAALSPAFAPLAAAQPIEPLGSARPSAPPAPPDVAEPPAEAVKAADGLAWKILSKGQGTARPGPHDKVRIAFTAWTPTGEPRSFPMDELMKGLSEGLRLMTKGEKRRFWIPASLAGAGRPRRSGPPTPAVFDVELVDFVKMPDPIPVPEDVAAPPADAKRTASGLAYKVLKHG
jgi:peptidylprolyl isomerase